MPLHITAPADQAMKQAAYHGLCAKAGYSLTVRSVIPSSLHTIAYMHGANLCMISV